VPVVVYSSSAHRDPSLAVRCGAAGALEVLGEDVGRLVAIVGALLVASRALAASFCPPPVSADTPAGFRELLRGHGLRELPEKDGGLLPVLVQELVLSLEWTLLRGAITPTVSAVARMGLPVGSWYLHGGTALAFHCARLGRCMPPTTDIDLRFRAKEDAGAAAGLIVAALAQRHAAWAADFATLGMVLGSPVAKEDSLGVRVSLAVTGRGVAFRWKIADVSHNWILDDPEVEVSSGAVGRFPAGAAVQGRRTLAACLGRAWPQQAHKDQRRRLRAAYWDWVNTTNG
jgi:hypothetical protein